MPQEKRSKINGRIANCKTLTSEAERRGNRAGLAPAMKAVDSKPPRSAKAAIYARYSSDMQSETSLAARRGT
jgi:hypothetical protein